MAIAIVEMDSNEEQQHAATNMSMPSSRHTPPNNQPKQQQHNSSRSSSESEQSSASKLFADPAGPSPARQVTVTAEQQASSRQQQNSNSLTANELWRMHQEQQRREENHALLQLLRQQQRQNDMLSGGGGNPMTSGTTSSSSTGMRNNFAATTQQRQQSLMDNINNNNFDMNPISIRRMGMDNSNSRLTMPEGSYLMNNRNRSDMMNNSNSSNLGSGMGINNNSMDRSSSLMNNRSTMDMSTSLRYMELLNNIMPTPMSAIRSSSAGMGDTTRTSSNFDTQLMNDNFMSSSFGNGSGRMGGMPSSSNNYGSSSAADYTSFNSELLLQQQLLNNESAYMKASSSSGMGGVGMSTSNNNLGPSSMASSSLLHHHQQFLNNNDPLYGKVTAPPKMYPQEDQGWEIQFKALQHYQMQFGHCRVPARFKANPKLGRWVMTQRRQFTLLMQGFPSALTAERIRRLETLGFTWSVRPEPVTTWNSKFQELKAYKATFGNVMVPQRYQANPQLGTWVHTQRRQYKLLMEGKKSSMTKEKAKALESLGFFWTATKTNAQKLQLPAKSDFKLELDASAGIESDSDYSDASDDLLKKPAAKR